MDSLEYRQMLEREKSVVDRLVMDMGDPVALVDRAKTKAFDALRLAEKQMHEYACLLDIGEERVKAFEIFENIRNAARVG